MTQQRAAQERVAEQFDVDMAEAQRVAFDWGGWYSFDTFIFDDGVESSRTFRRHDLRLWARASFDRDTHQVYARVRTSLLDFNSGDSYDGDDDDVEGPNLERGTYRVDLLKAFGAGGADHALAQTLGHELSLTLGRDLVVFGNGLSLATTLDHAAVQARYGKFSLRGLAGRTVGSSVDVDLTRPGDRTRRVFYGLEGMYHGFERHRPFAYVLWQRDQNPDPLFPIGQDFEYNSFYGGLGSRGELADHLRYAVEAAIETGAGRNYGFLAGNNEIEAFAVNAELEYLFPGKFRPRASIEYLFGSGDSDRRLSPTDTIGGNRGDHLDSSFVGFGYQDTGLALAPTASNLHMFRAGGSFYPFPDRGRQRVHPIPETRARTPRPRWRRGQGEGVSGRALGSLELGTDWYVFHKHHRDGAVSDLVSDVRSGYVGFEMDCFANWRIAPDLAWTARLGAFFPGDAYTDQTTRTFFLMGIVWSF